MLGLVKYSTSAKFDYQKILTIIFHCMGGNTPDIETKLRPAHTVSSKFKAA